MISERVQSSLLAETSDWKRGFFSIGGFKGERREWSGGGKRLKKKVFHWARKGGREKRVFFLLVSFSSGIWSSR